MLSHRVADRAACVGASEADALQDPLGVVPSLVGEHKGARLVLSDVQYIGLQEGDALARPDAIQDGGTEGVA